MPLLLGLGAISYRDGEEERWRCSANSACDMLLLPPPLSHTLTPTPAHNRVPIPPLRDRLSAINCLLSIGCRDQRKRILSTGPGRKHMSVNMLLCYA